MSFVVACIDPEDPKESMLIEDENGDTAVFETKAEAEKFVKKDEKDFPDAYDYHVLEV
jgi:hypothetical protein